MSHLFDRKAISVLLLLCMALLPARVEAQQRQLLNFELRTALSQMDAQDELPVYLRGHVPSIIGFVRSEEGRLKGVFANIVSCALPVQAFAKLNELPFVEFVEFSLSRPELMGDQMILNNNVLPVHQGIGPLPEMYQGDDVIIGIIDTGIELAHPDFRNGDNSTRVIALWDQTQPETFPFRVPQPYGYGQEWNAEEIDAGLSNHGDQAAYFGHGSTVAGAALGNANASGDYLGVAPKADIIIVSSNFNSPNWKMTVAESVEWIFAKAEAIGKPVVVNASLGDYYGSHDALDAPALHIESMLDAAPGRVMVAAAGNSDQFARYHLGYNIPEADTAFTWFSFNANSALGYGAVFFECWADVADFANARFTLGADLTTPSYQFRGYASWRSAAANLNTVITDTIFFNSAILGIVHSWCGQRGDQYQIQMVLTEPFSNQYRWRFATTGGGRIDCWSHAPFGTSAIVSTSLPDAGAFPDILKYRMPDKEMTIVDSWTCSDKVLTVGNYVNRSSFPNYWGGTTNYPYTTGAISINCSRGPTRDLRLKPNIAATGDVTLSAGRLATIANMIATNAQNLAPSGLHYSNGGTSMASPVVAGVAALYLSRCPLATWADVKDALLNTAIADMHTGSLPGFQFGHGKTDAFGALSSSVAPINFASNAFDFCQGGSVTINAPSGYTHYQWSNGVEGDELTSDVASEVFLSARDAKGCLQRSPMIEIIELESPPIPVIVQAGQVLTASGSNVEWQWILNGEWISGATGPAYTPELSGTYQVVVTGSNGCQAQSEPFEFILTSVADGANTRSFSIFPNPGSGMFTLVHPLSGNVVAKVVDVSGRLVAVKEWQGLMPGSSTLDLQSLASGAYMLVIEGVEGQIYKQKLFIEK